MEDNKVQSPVQYPVQAIVSSDKKFGWNLLPAVILFEPARIGYIY